MNAGPDLTTTIIEREYISNPRGGWTLRVGGYLLAVSVEIDLAQMYQRPEEVLRFEITDNNGIAEYGAFLVPIHVGMHHGGQAFWPPMPNMNTAAPYVLRMPEDTPPFWVYTANCLPQHS